MECLKCGREIPSEQTFCEECLQDMDKHPVKPGTPIVLPYRQHNAPPKRTKKHTVKPEEQIRSQRTVITWLMILIMTLMIALTFTVTMLLKVMDVDDFSFLPGQNYGSESSTVLPEDR